MQPFCKIGVYMKAHKMFPKINAYSEIVMNLVKMSQMEINELIRSEAKRIVYVLPTHFVCGYRFRILYKILYAI